MAHSHFFRTSERSVEYLGMFTKDEIEYCIDLHIYGWRQFYRVRKYNKKGNFIGTGTQEDVNHFLEKKA